MNTSSIFSTQYSFGRTVALSFADAITRVTHALADEGFGVLTDIDVAATMKQKLDQDMPPYRILGACNPQLAYCAIQRELSIGLLLPCNVVVRQDSAGCVRVEFMDPDVVLALVGKSEINQIAQEARKRLVRVMAAMGVRVETRPGSAYHVGIPLPATVQDGQAAAMA